MRRYWSMVSLSSGLASSRRPILNRHKTLSLNFNAFININCIPQFNIQIFSPHIFSFLLSAIKKSKQRQTGKGYRVIKKYENNFFSCTPSETNYCLDQYKQRPSLYIILQYCFFFNMPWLMTVFLCLFSTLFNRIFIAICNCFLAIISIIIFLYNAVCKHSHANKCTNK